MVSLMTILLLFYLAIMKHDFVVWCYVNYVVLFSYFLFSCCHGVDPFLLGVLSCFVINYKKKKKCKMDGAPCRDLIPTLYLGVKNINGP